MGKERASYDIIVLGYWGIICQGPFDTMQTHPNWGMETFISRFLVPGPLGSSIPWPFWAGALRQV